MTKIAVFNLGISNLTSVLNILDYVGAKYYLVDDVDGLKNAQKMFLPGVGTFAAGIAALEQRNLIDQIKKKVLHEKIPIFGICLGMQMLFEFSEESVGINGIGLLKGKIVKIPENKEYQIPRIGWAKSEIKKDFLGLKKNASSDFYYIHSYHACPQDNEIVTITSQNDSIVAAIAKENIFGCQFHPEKSHIDGVELIRNFTKI